MPLIVRNKRLKELNTFGIEAHTHYYCEFSDAADLRNIFSDPALAQQKWMVVGGGSNVLFTCDFDGLVLHPVSRGVSVVALDGVWARVKADAGVDWDGFVDFTVSSGYSGLENLSGIPGYVGASPVQNIGAYGCEAKDTIESVEVYFTDNGRVEDVPGEKCRFGYRDSIFKNELRGRAIVLSVTFRLSTTPILNLGYRGLADVVSELGGATPENVRQAVLTIRDQKLPDPKEIGNSGSFFKNPVVDEPLALRLKEQYPDMPQYACGAKYKLAAGYLIDRAGWKGYREGDAGVHAKQALVLVNYGAATGKEIAALADRIIDDIKTKFGVEIEPEVNII